MKHLLTISMLIVLGIAFGMRSEMKTVIINNQSNITLDRIGYDTNGLESAITMQAIAPNTSKQVTLQNKPFWIGGLTTEDKVFAYTQCDSKSILCKLSADKNEYVVTANPMLCSNLCPQGNCLNKEAYCEIRLNFKAK